MSAAATETKTYRGKALEELIPLIRAELGEDAVVLERREALSGGFAGFFRKRHVEVVAAAASAISAAPGFDAHDGEDVVPDLASQGVPVLMTAPEPQPTDAGERPTAEEPAAQDGAPGSGTRSAVSAPFADALAALEASTVGPDEGDDATGGLSDELAAQIHAEVVAAEEDGEPAEEDEAEGVGVEPAHDDGPAPTPPEPEPDVPPIPTLPVAFSPRPAPRAFVRSLSAAPALPTAEAQAMLAQLTARGLSEAFAQDAIEHVLHHLAPVAGPDAELRDLLRAALAARIPIFVPHHGARGRVVGVVGAAGSGKTALVARLAEAYAAGQDRPVACVALRPDDEGLALTRRLRPAGVELFVEADVEAAAARVDGLRGEGVVLLDTPGASPRDEAGLRDLASDLDRIDVDERHLVVPATLGAASGRELVAGARALGAEAIAVTHLDETRQLGTVVELAAKTELPLSVVSRGAALRPAIADELARELLDG